MKITWATIIPLIGGLPLAMKKVFRSNPEYVLSFNAFQPNDSHFINYLRTHDWKGDYINVDEGKKNIIEDTKQYELVKDSLPQVDVIGCVAPCAGLSSLSPISKSDSPINDWMYKSAEIALKNLKPKIFWGENSIFLGMNKGRPVAEKLAQIGKENGYHLLLYCTKNKYHGSPQNRPRTFYFFFRKDEFKECPLVDPLEKFSTTIEELLDKVELKKNDPMNQIIFTDEKLEDNPFYKYWYWFHVATSHRDLVEKMSDPDQETIPASIIHQACYHHKEHLQVLMYWMAERGYDKVVKRLKHVEEKFKQNKGAWLRGPQIARGLIPAYVSDQILFLVHPREQRYLTFREGLSIMGMPKDFCLIGNLRQNRNHIGQNVCVDTAAVFVKEIKKFLNHKNTANYKINNEYIIQDHNKDDKLEIRKIKE